MNYAIKSGEAYWGPFKTADAAAKWAVKNLVDTCRYQIVPLIKPSGR